MTVTIDIASAAKVLVVIVFVALIAYVLYAAVTNVKRFFASRNFARNDRAAMRKRWLEIEAMVRETGEVNRKLAVIEADKLLDSALRSLAMPGNTLGERLKFAAYKYPELRSVWWAHRVRNQLAHEATFHLDPGLAVKAVREFRRALQRLGAI